MPRLRQLREPLAAQGTVARRECKFLVLPDARIQPRRRIAETFAAVFAPLAGAAADSVRTQGVFSVFRGPSQFSARPCRNFPADQRLVRPAPSIPEPQPHEMKNLVSEDAGKLAGVAIEGDAPLPQESASMHGSVPIAQAHMLMNPDGPPRQRRPAPRDAPRPRCRHVPVKYERKLERHCLSA